MFWHVVIGESPHRSACSPVSSLSLALSIVSYLRAPGQRLPITASGERITILTVEKQVTLF